MKRGGKECSYHKITSISCYAMTDLKQEAYLRQLSYDYYYVILLFVSYSSLFDPLYRFINGAASTNWDFWDGSSLHDPAFFVRVVAELLHVADDSWVPFLCYVQ